MLPHTARFTALLVAFLVALAVPAEAHHREGHDKGSSDGGSDPDPTPPTPMKLHLRDGPDGRYLGAPPGAADRMPSTAELADSPGWTYDGTVDDGGERIGVSFWRTYHRSESPDVSTHEESKELICYYWGWDYRCRYVPMLDPSVTWSSKVTQNVRLELLDGGVVVASSAGAVSASVAPWMDAAGEVRLSGYLPPLPDVAHDQFRLVLVHDGDGAPHQALYDSHPYNGCVIFLDFARCDDADHLDTVEALAEGDVGTLVDDVPADDAISFVRCDAPSMVFGHCTLSNLLGPGCHRPYPSILGFCAFH